MAKLENTRPSRHDLHQRRWDDRTATGRGRTTRKATGWGRRLGGLWKSRTSTTYGVELALLVEHVGCVVRQRASPLPPLPPPHTVSRARCCCCRCSCCCRCCCSSLLLLALDAARRGAVVHGCEENAKFRATASPDCPAQARARDRAREPAGRAAWPPRDSCACRRRAPCARRAAGTRGHSSP